MTFANKVRALAGVAKSLFWTNENLQHYVEWNGITASSTPIQYDKLIAAAWRNPYVIRAFEIIAGTFSELPIAVEMSDKRGNTEIVEDHPILRLLERPNQGQSWPLFSQEMLAHIYNAGEFFVYRDAALTGDNKGKPIEIELLTPGGVEFKEVNRATLKPRYKTYRNEEGHVVTLEDDHLNHYKEFSPRSKMRGYPRMAAIIDSIDLMSDGNAWNKATVQHKGRMPGWFMNTTGNRLTNDQFKRVKEEMQEAYAQDSRDARPGVLDSGFQWVQNASSQKDSEWSSMDDRAAKKIALGMGVGPSILGDTGTRTHANQTAEMRAVYIHTTLPLAGRILGEIAHWFMPFYGTPEARLVILTEHIDELQEDQNERATRLVKLTGEGILTRNDAREELGHKLSKDPMADQLLVPVNRMPLSEVMPPEPVSPEPTGDSQPVDPAQIEVSVN